MSYENVPLRDKAFANLFSIASRSLKLVPALDRLIVGRNTIPDGWHVSRVDASEFDTWLPFNGVKEKSSRLSRKFSHMAMMSVLEADVQLIREKRSAFQDAIAIALGRAVAVGVLAEDSRFTRVEGYPGRLLAAAGIGPDRTPPDVDPKPVLFMPVEYNPSEDIILVPGSPHSEGRVATRDLPSELARSIANRT